MCFLPGSKKYFTCILSWGIWYCAKKSELVAAVGIYTRVREINQPDWLGYSKDSLAVDWFFQKHLQKTRVMMFPIKRPNGRKNEGCLPTSPESIDLLDVYFGDPDLSVRQSTDAPNGIQPLSMDSQLAASLRWCRDGIAIYQREPGLPTTLEWLSISFSLFFKRRLHKCNVGIRCGTRGEMGKRGAKKIPTPVRFELTPPKGRDTLQV